MHLDHVNLTVSDVLQARAFFKRHFACTDAFDATADMAVLLDTNGMYLNLMRGPQPTYPKTFHIGFGLDSAAAVTARYHRLIDDGLHIKPPKHAWGAWTFHFTCPGATFVIEVACASEAAA